MNVISAIETPGGSVAAPGRSFTVAIVGGGAAGITVAAQLQKRRRDLRIAVIEPSDTHSCQIHVTPPQSAPDFIKASPLANEGGWIAVDPATLRHTRFTNVFGLGDAAGTTNAKTAAVVRLQAPVVVDGVLAAIDGEVSTGRYDGYGSCPLTTAYGKVVLAEFIYGGKVTPSFPLDPRVPRTSAWLLKTKLLPFMYWQLMLRGNTFDIKHRERPLAVAG